MLIFSMLGTFILLFLLLGAVLAVVWHHWPAATGVFMGTFLIFGVFSSLNRRIAVARILGGGPTPPRVGMDCDYIGRYTEHWEIPHILVFTGYRLFGLLPHFEKWLPEGNCDLPSSVEDRGSAQHYLHFSGIVSDLGRFGHKGIGDRTVGVSRLIDSFDWPDERSIFFSGGPRTRAAKAEHYVAPNRSLPPFLNSTSSDRGSEDF